MVEPKNAITKQYKTMFKLDGIDLEIDDNAISAVAKKAIELKTGARGLRTIMEQSMLDLMFKTPSDKSIKKITLSADSILNKKEPIIIRQELKPEEVKEEKIKEKKPEKAVNLVS